MKKQINKERNPPSKDIKIRMDEFEIELQQQKQLNDVNMEKLTRGSGFVLALQNELQENHNLNESSQIVSKSSGQMLQSRKWSLCALLSHETQCLCLHSSPEVSSTFLQIPFTPKQDIVLTAEKVFKLCISTPTRWSRRG